MIIYLPGVISFSSISLSIRFYDLRKASKITQRNTN